MNKILFLSAVAVAYYLLNGGDISSIDGVKADASKQYTNFKQDFDNVKGDILNYLNK